MPGGTGRDRSTAARRAPQGRRRGPHSRPRGSSTPGTTRVRGPAAPSEPPRPDVRRAARRGPTAPWGRRVGARRRPVRRRADRAGPGAAGRCRTTWRRSPLHGRADEGIRSWNIRRSLGGVRDRRCMRARTPHPGAMILQLRGVRSPWTLRYSAASQGPRSSSSMPRSEVSAVRVRAMAAARRICAARSG